MLVDVCGRGLLFSFVGVGHCGDDGYGSWGGLSESDRL